MRIDPETVERIKQTAAVADVIGDYVTIKKRVPIIGLVARFMARKHLRFQSHRVREFINVLVVVRRVILCALSWILRGLAMARR